MSARNFDLKGTKKRFGNVTISRDKDNGRFLEVFLHGHNVFTLDQKKGVVMLSNCGWVTPTTHNAINTTLRQLDAPIRVGNGKGKTVISGPKINRPLINGEWLRF